MPRRATDPFAAFNFKLELDGVTKAAFSECSGLSQEADVIEYRDGNDKVNSVRKQHGLTKFGNITLKRGFTKDRGLFDWFDQVKDGDVKRLPKVCIVVNNEKHEEAIRWILKEAWPNKWTGPDLKASGSELAIETLEFVCEGLEWG